MKLLALETSGPLLSLAAFENGSLKLELSEAALMRQNESLAPLTEKLLTQLGWKASELNAVAVSLGPGSFTGLRTGLAFAKGLCYANSASLVGIPTLDAWAEGQAAAEVWLDARRGMIYRRKPGRDAEMLELEKARAELRPGTAVLGDAIEPKRQPSAARVGRLALLRLEKGERDDAALLEPLYLRRPEAEILWEKLHPPTEGASGGT